MTRAVHHLCGTVERLPRFAVPRHSCGTCKFIVREAERGFRLRRALPLTQENRRGR